MLTPSSLPKFDPARPLPRPSLADVMATGVGQADTGRLWLVTVLGGATMLAIVTFAPERWLTGMPLVCLSAFGSHGLATQKIFDLDIRSRSAPRLRRVLRAVRIAASVTGSAAGLVWLLGLLAHGVGGRG